MLDVLHFCNSFSILFSLLLTTKSSSLKKISCEGELGECHSHTATIGGGQLPRLLPHTHQSKTWNQSEVASHTPHGRIVARLDLGK